MIQITNPNPPLEEQVSDLNHQSLFSENNSNHKPQSWGGGGDLIGVKKSKFDWNLLYDLLSDRLT